MQFLTYYFVYCKYLWIWTENYFSLLLCCVFLHLSRITGIYQPYDILQFLLIVSWKEIIFNYFRIYNLHLESKHFFMNCLARDSFCQPFLLL